VIEECQLELAESSEAEKDTDICLALVKALNRKEIQPEKTCSKGSFFSKI